MSVRDRITLYQRYRVLLALGLIMLNMVGYGTSHKGKRLGEIPCAKTDNPR